MTFTIKGSHIFAILITAIIGVWMYYGEIEIGGQSNTQNQTKPIAARSETTKTDLFKVSYVTLTSENRSRVINLRGRTKAEAIIPVRAETSGVLEKRLAGRGDFVKEGDLVCVISRGARQANLQSAKARLAQTQADYEANTKLVKKGFVTQARMRELKFDLNAAQSQLKQAELELGHTEIRAKAAGIVQDPIAEPGDVLNIGETCITLVDRDPMFFTGQLSESDILNVKSGMSAKVELVTGTSVEGTITYIAPSADPQTRTFLTDIRLKNSNINIRGGLTAMASINLQETKAFKISPSWLTLAEDGTLGVKTLDDADKVNFNPVKVLSQTNDGFWIEGIEQNARVITQGQEYVISNETVSPVPDARFNPLVQG